MEIIKQSNIAIFRRMALAVGYLGVTAIVVMMFIAYPRINGYDAAMFGETVYGQAHKPFVYRTLVPTVVRTISEVVPKSLTDRFDVFGMKQFTPSRLISIARIEQEYVFEFFTALFVFAFCFVGFALSLRAIIRHQYNFPDWVSDLAPLGVLLMTPMFFRYYNYMYDPAVLLFMALGTYLIISRKRALYYLIFVLAAFNKETSALLIGLFVVFEYNDMKRPKLIVHVVAQLILYLAVRALIYRLYMDSPGLPVEFTLISRNLIAYTRSLSMLFAFLIFAVYYLLISQNWKSKPRFLRHGFVILIVPLFISIMLFGVIDEIRVFYEVYPLASLLALPTILEILGISSPKQISHESS